MEIPKKSKKLTLHEVRNCNGNEVQKTIVIK